MTAEANDVDRLEKRLGLVDVYAICTGAMFSSGFFLLPGVAAARAGPAVILAYLVSSLLMIPHLFSIAELSSAMPRAAGTYFFIHRSLGPLAGTIGGFGDWLTLTFKSAFALVGMGAYLAIFVEVPIQPVAIGLTVAFAALNILGAKETARLQVWLVSALLAIMAFYLVQGGYNLLGAEAQTLASDRMSPFFTVSATGFASTIGLVFISYAGLTKVAAAAEEVDDLDRNLPLGMILSLATISVIYVAGVSLMVAFIEMDALQMDLTPVATAGDAFLGWLPGPTGLVLVVTAAILAFASTGNAGILTASRYPLAMARDRLTWSGFDRLGRFGTPTIGILATSAMMITAILFLDVERLASLGSAFLLFIFALVNLSVIIFRESRIASYVPGFRSPLYPWVQLIGIVTSIGLIATLGPFYVGFVLVIVAAATLWYRYYARSRTQRRGAVYSLFLRLGQLRDQGVDQELWGILQERGASDADFFDEIVARAHVLDHKAATMERLGAEISQALADRTGASRAEIEQRLLAAAPDGVIPNSRAAIIYPVVVEGVDHPEIALVRVRDGIAIDAARQFPGQDAEDQDAGETATRVSALIFLLSPAEQPTQHLRLLAQLAAVTEEPSFSSAWSRASAEQELLETILRDERFVSVEVLDHGPTAGWVDRQLKELTFPGDTLVALVRRDGRSLIPHGDTTLRRGDRITVVGRPEDVSQLFGDAQP
jgi:basic amino acid/polyamine antiporter, APA family